MMVNSSFCASTHSIRCSDRTQAVCKTTHLTHFNCQRNAHNDTLCKRFNLFFDIGTPGRHSQSHKPARARISIKPGTAAAASSQPESARAHGNSNSKRTHKTYHVALCVMRLSLHYITHANTRHTDPSTNTFLASTRMHACIPIART